MRKACVGTWAHTIDRDIKVEITAQNTSLEFKSCLFRVEDIPISVEAGEKVEIEKALSCLDWEHKFIYNFESKAFSSPKEIDPICGPN